MEEENSDVDEESPMDGAHVQLPTYTPDTETTSLPVSLFPMLPLVMACSCPNRCAPQPASAADRSSSSSSTTQRHQPSARAQHSASVFAAAPCSNPSSEQQSTAEGTRPLPHHPPIKRRAIQRSWAPGCSSDHGNCSSRSRNGRRSHGSNYPAFHHRLPGSNLYAHHSSSSSQRRGWSPGGRRAGGSQSGSGSASVCSLLSAFTLPSAASNNPISPPVNTSTPLESPRLAVAESANPSREPSPMAGAAAFSADSPLPRGDSSVMMIDDSVASRSQSESSSNGLDASGSPVLHVADDFADGNLPATPTVGQSIIDLTQSSDEDERPVSDSVQSIDASPTLSDVLSSGGGGGTAGEGSLRQERVELCVDLGRPTPQAVTYRQYPPASVGSHRPESSPQVEVVDAGPSNTRVIDPFTHTAVDIGWLLSLAQATDGAPSQQHRLPIASPRHAMPRTHHNCALHDGSSGDHHHHHHHHLLTTALQQQQPAASASGQAPQLIQVNPTGLSIGSRNSTPGPSRSCSGVGGIAQCHCFPQASPHTCCGGFANGPPSAWTHHMHVSGRPIYGRSPSTASSLSPHQQLVGCHHCICHCSCHHCSTPQQHAMHHSSAECPSAGHSELEREQFASASEPASGALSSSVSPDLNHPVPPPTLVVPAPRLSPLASTASMTPAPPVMIPWWSPVAAQPHHSAVILPQAAASSTNLAQRQPQAEMPQMHTPVVTFQSVQPSIFRQSQPGGDAITVTVEPNPSAAAWMLPISLHSTVPSCVGAYAAANVISASQAANAATAAGTRPPDHSNLPLSQQRRLLSQRQQLARQRDAHARWYENRQHHQGAAAGLSPYVYPPYVEVPGLIFPPATPAPAGSATDFLDVRGSNLVSPHSTMIPPPAAVFQAVTAAPPAMSVSGQLLALADSLAQLPTAPRMSSMPTEADFVSSGASSFVRLNPRVTPTYGRAPMAAQYIQPYAMTPMLLGHPPAANFIAAPSAAPGAYVPVLDPAGPPHEWILGTSSAAVAASRALERQATMLPTASRLGYAYSNMVAASHMEMMVQGIGEAHTEMPRGASLSLIDKCTVTHSYKRTGDELENCVICLNEIEDADMVRSLPCMHFYHTACIDRWLVEDKRCPMCRVEIDGAGGARRSTTSELLHAPGPSRLIV